MKKRILAGLLGTAFILNFTGCATSDDAIKQTVPDIYVPEVNEITTEEPTETLTEAPTEEPTEPGMSEEEKNAFMEKSAKAVISYVGEILVDNPTYVVTKLDTIEGHYVEILFWAEPEIYAKDLYVEQNPGKKSAFMATAWVTDELEVTECYLDAYNEISRERAALGLEGKPYYDAAKESEHYAAKEIIEKKLAEFKNNEYGYTSKTFSDEEVWKIYDEYMTERLCSKETVKREDVIKKEVYDTYDYTCTKVYNEKGILIEMEEVDRYSTSKFIYNDEGCLINDNGVKYEVVKEYDKNGNFVRDIGYHNSLIYWICEYDINGNLTRVYKKDEEEIYYEYDENGYLIKKERYEYTNDERTFYSWIEYENDENGRMTKWTKCDSEGKPYLSKYYTYDNAGNVIKMEQREDNYHPSGYEVTVYYIYDSEGRLIREYKYGEELDVIQIYEYTIWGDEVDDDYTIEYDYTYYDSGEVETAKVYTVSEDGTRTYNVFREYDIYGRLIGKSYYTYYT